MSKKSLYRLLLGLSLAGAVIALSTLPQQSPVQANTQATAQTLQQTVDQLNQGDFSSLEGTWKNGKGNTMVIAKDGKFFADANPYLPAFLPEAVLKTNAGVGEIWIQADYGDSDGLRPPYAYVPAGAKDTSNQGDSKKARLYPVEATNRPQADDYYYQLTDKASLQEASPAQVEAFWATYLAAINQSIQAGQDKTQPLWAGQQPAHVQELMADYIAKGQLQPLGGRTYKIIKQDAKSLTFTINGSRTVVLEKTGVSFKIKSFDF